VQRWTKFVKDLADLEALAVNNSESDDVRLAFRKRLVAGKMPAEYQEQYQQKLAPIRNCRQHLGQAFSERSEGRVAIGSCYLCQLTQNFNIADEGQDGDDALKKFNVLARRNNAASCAEVACSAYCLGEASP
jgi:hypothetical protein